MMFTVLIKKDWTGNLLHESCWLSLVKKMVQHFKVNEELVNKMVYADAGCLAWLLCCDFKNSQIMKRLTSVSEND